MVNVQFFHTFQIFKHLFIMFGFQFNNLLALASIRFCIGKTNGIFKIRRKLKSKR